jgi:hypothetical protein
MILAALVAGLVAFVALLKLLRAAEVAGAALATARAALATMRAPELGDDAKELAVRRAAGAMLASFLRIALIALVALAAPALIVWAGSAAGFYSLDRAAEVATGWRFLLASSVGAVLAWAALERLA